MGTIFSIVHSLRHLAERVLTLGAAASAGALQSFHIDFFELITHFHEAVEAEPHDRYSEIIDTLCVRDTHPLAAVNVPVSVGCSAPCRNLNAIPRSLQQATVWRSQTVEAKKKYVAAADQAKRKALRFRRRFDRYGPPDWIDPALAILPSMGLLGNLPDNIFSSVFPFAAPHIVISPPPYSDLNTAVASGVPCQDEAFGNRLIVAQPSSKNMPLPVVINPSRQRPLKAGDLNHGTSIDGLLSGSHNSDNGASDVPSLEIDYDVSHCTSECSAEECLHDSDDASSPPTPPDEEGPFRNAVLSPSQSTFWIEEDEDELPELPENW